MIHRMTFFRTVPFVAAMLLAPAGRPVAAEGITPAAGPAPQSEQYQGPSALAVSRTGRTLYVACEDAGQVAWSSCPAAESPGG